MCVPVCSVRGSKTRRNQKVFLASNKNERKIVWKKLNRRLIFADESNGAACERDGERESRCIDWNAHPRSYKLLIIIMKPKKRTEKFAWIKFLRNQFDVGPELRDEHEWWKIFFILCFFWFLEWSHKVTHSTVKDCRLWFFLRRRMDNLPTELRVLFNGAVPVPGSVLFKHPK